MRDILNRLTSRRAISPVSEGGNNALVSQIIDRQGFDSLLFVIATGSLADIDATFAVTMDDGDASDLTGSAAVAAVELNGTLAAASFTFADDDKVRELGYIGGRRYVRLTITPSANSGAAVISAVAILGNPHIQP